MGDESSTLFHDLTKMLCLPGSGKRELDRVTRECGQQLQVALKKQVARMLLQSLSGVASLDNPVVEISVNVLPSQRTYPAEFTFRPFHRQAPPSAPANVHQPHTGTADLSIDEDSEPDLAAVMTADKASNAPAVTDYNSSITLQKKLECHECPVLCKG